MKDIFIHALTLPPHARGATLDYECAGNPALRAQIESLLARDSQDSWLDQPLTDATLLKIFGDDDADPLGPLPEHVGRYRITGVLGMGSGGVVYLARQHSPDREVAVKVLRVDAPTARRRFERESQLMAAMRHPGIAHVYEHGIDPESRQPYIAMEVVSGAKPITLFADDRNLDERARIELLVQACDAIQHAHAAGVLHRDLKPANLLVDASGTVKIVDFGVGRWLASPGTLAGALVGTLNYASPEQLRGESATPGDVYSLGAVLYELLCGRPVVALHGLDTFQALRHIDAHDPPPPGQVNPACRGALNAVVLKSIDKSLSRRYATVAQFADDLRRVLSGDPVAARADTLTDSVRRVSRRHPAITAALTALVLASVLWGGWAWRQRERELLAASQLSNAAVRALDFIETRPGSTPIRQSLVDSYLPVTEQLVRARPQDDDARYLLARLWDVKSDLYLQARNDAPVRELRNRSLAMMTALAKENPDSFKFAHRHSLAMVRVGDLDCDAGDVPAAARLYKEAFAIQERLAQTNANDTALLDDIGWSYARLAHLRVLEQDYDGALVLIEKHLASAQMLADRDRTRPEPYWALVNAHAQAANVLEVLDRRDEFERHLRQSLTAAERLVQLNPDERRHISHLAIREIELASRVEIPAGRLTEALAFAARAQTRVDTLNRLDPDSPDSLSTEYLLINLQAKIAESQGNPQQAEQLWRQSLALTQRLNEIEQNPSESTKRTRNVNDQIDLLRTKTSGQRPNP